MRYGDLMIKPRKRPQEFNQAAQAGGRHRHVALPLGPHPDWDTVRRSTDLTRLDIDFREMGELSAFVHMPTFPDPKECLIADLNQAWCAVPGASVGLPDIAADQRAPPACRCDILVACPANDGPIVSLAQFRSKMVQHCGRSTMSESSCSTTFPKTTKRGGHGRRHARYCSLPLMAWPMSAQSHAKSNLRYFSKPSRWRNDRGARLDFLRSRWAQRCEIVKACKDRGIGIWYLLPLIWF